MKTRQRFQPLAFSSTALLGGRRRSVTKTAREAPTVAPAWLTLRACARCCATAEILTAASRTTTTASACATNGETTMTTWAYEYVTLLEDCEKRSEKLTDWELGFVDSLQRQLADGRRPTAKQIETLDRVWEKATARG